MTKRKKSLGIELNARILSKEEFEDLRKVIGNKDNAVIYKNEIYFNYNNTDLSAFALGLLTDYACKGYKILYAEYPEIFAKRRAYAFTRLCLSKEKHNAKSINPVFISKYLYVKDEDIVRTVSTMFNCMQEDVKIGPIVIGTKPYAICCPVKAEKFCGCKIQI